MRVIASPLAQLADALGKLGRMVVALATDSTEGRRLAATDREEGALIAILYWHAHIWG